MQIILFIIATVAAYLIGSINSSIIVGKILTGTDVREHGSGNAGATNALRTFGKKAGALTLLGDILKAVIVMTPLVILNNQLIFEGQLGMASETHTLWGNISQYLIYSAGLAVVLGHNFPIFFGFRGGKGVLVSTIVLIFVDPVLGISTFAVGTAVIALSKYVSLGSIAGSLASIIFAIVFRGYDLYYIIFTILLAISLIIMHRGNIKRLLNKTESKLGKGKKDAQRDTEGSE